MRWGTQALSSKDTTENIQIYLLCELSPNETKAEWKAMGFLFLIHLLRVEYMFIWAKYQQICFLKRILSLSIFYFHIKIGKRIWQKFKNIDRPYQEKNY